MSLRFTRGALYGCLVSVGQAKSNVFGNGAGKEEDILLNRRNLRAQRLQIPIAGVNTINQDTAVVGIKNPVDQAGECCFA